jgi:hypothetical protein
LKGDEVKTQKPKKPVKGCGIPKSVYKVELREQGRWRRLRQTFIVKADIEGLIVSVDPARVRIVEVKTNEVRGNFDVA